MRQQARSSSSLRAVVLLVPLVLQSTAVASTLRHGTQHTATTNLPLLRGLLAAHARLRTGVRARERHMIRQKILFGLIFAFIVLLPVTNIDILRGQTFHIDTKMSAQPRNPVTPDQVGLAPSTAAPCVVCPQAVHSCEESCGKCRVSAQTCVNCSEAVCMDEVYSEMTVAPTIGSSDHAMVVLVLSRLDVFDTRQAIRKTWAKDHTNVYFVVGTCCPIPLAFRKQWTCKQASVPSAKEQEDWDTTCETVDRRLLEEQAAYGDLIRIEEVDVYRHLPQKVKAAYARALDLTAAAWFVKTDTDSVVRVDTLEHYLTTKYDAAKPVVVGHINRGSGVPRSGKWAELNYIKNTYPPWPQGSFGHVVSRPVAEYVVTHKDALFNYQGEDISLAIWLDESPLKNQIVWKTTKHFANHGNCEDPNLWMIGHNIKPSKMRACFAHMDEAAHVTKPPVVLLKTRALGRLGNNVFQFASGVGIAAVNGAKLCMPRATMTLLTSTFVGPFPPECPPSASFPPAIVEKGYARYEDFDFSKGNVAIGRGSNDGFLQSWRYFDRVKDKVRERLQFKPVIQEQAAAYVQSHRKGAAKMVGIHVRKGDTECGLCGGKRYLLFPSDSYVEKAMAHFQGEVHFIVASDNSTWCASQKVFQRPNIHVVTETHTGSLDLAILASCDAVITTIGTFGWWAGWLSNGDVVYYKDQFVMDHAINKGKVVEADYYPEGWVGLGDDVPVGGASVSIWETHLPSSRTSNDWCPTKNSAGASFVQSLYTEAAGLTTSCENSQRIGGSGDGGKLICTDTIRSHDCIVYSLGSRLDFTFETSIVKRFGCKVHTFDCTVGTPIETEIPDGVVFHPWCVGEKDELKAISSDLGHQGESGQYYTLATILKTLGHETIDLLKMDIERHEFAVVASLTLDTAPSQLAFETHLHNAYGMWGRPVSETEWSTLWSTLHTLGYGVFAHEPNPLCLCCCEFSVLREVSETSRVAERVDSTIVTAYFDIPSKHSSSEYKTWMTNMLSLQDAMVIYTTPDLVDTIREFRKHARNRTHIVPIHLKDTRMATSYDAAFWKAQNVLDPERARHTDVRLYWIWNEKVEFLHRTVHSNPFQSIFWAWVDIGYFRTTAYNGKQMLRYVPDTLLPDQVLMLDVTSMVDARQHPNDRLGAGFIGGYPEGIARFHSGFYSVLKDNEGSFIGKEQPMMWKTCDANPGLCYVVGPDRAHGDSWFFMAPYMMGLTEDNTMRPIATSAVVSPSKPPPKHYIAEPPNEITFWATNEDRQFMAQLYPKLGQFSAILDVGARGYTARCKGMIASETTKYYQLEPYPPNSGLNNDGLLETTMQGSLAKYPEYRQSFDAVVDYGVLGWGAIEFSKQDIKDYIRNVRGLLKNGGLWALKIDKDAHKRMDYMLPALIEPYFESSDFAGFKNGMAIGTKGKTAYFFYKMETRRPGNNATTEAFVASLYSSKMDPDADAECNIVVSTMNNLALYDKIGPNLTPIDTKQQTCPASKATYTNGALRFRGNVDGVTVSTVAFDRCMKQLDGSGLPKGGYSDPQWRPVTEKETSLESEFVRVRYPGGDEERFVQAQPKKQVGGRQTNSENPNVLLLVVDNLSRQAATWILPKTMAFLRNRSKNTFVFNRMGSTGHSTAPSMTPILTGKPYDMDALDRDRVRTRRYTPSDIVEADIITTVARANGYVTTYATNYADSMFLGCYWWDRSWFDHVGPPPGKEGESNSECFGQFTNHQHGFSYIRSLWDTYEPLEHPVFTYYHAFHGHGDPVHANVLDVDIMLLVKEALSRNTVVLLIGDHGPYAQYQSKLPLATISVPNTLATTLGIGDAAAMNQRRLVSQYDLYQTLRFLVSPHANAATTKALGINLAMDSVSRTRSCAEAGIPDFRCFCSIFTPVAELPSEWKDAAEAGINKEGHTVAPQDCARARVTAVRLVRRMVTCIGQSRFHFHRGCDYDHAPHQEVQWVADVETSLRQNFTVRLSLSRTGLSPEGKPLPFENIETDAQRDTYVVASAKAREKVMRFSTELKSIDVKQLTRYKRYEGCTPANASAQFCVCDHTSIQSTQKTLLVVAHPDDEVVFLRKRPRRVHLRRGGDKRQFSRNRCPSPTSLQESNGGRGRD